MPQREAGLAGARSQGTQRPWPWETEGAKSSAPSRTACHADVSGAPGGHDKDVKPAGGRCAFLLRQLLASSFPPGRASREMLGAVGTRLASFSKK